MSPSLLLEDEAIRVGVADFMVFGTEGEGKEQGDIEPQSGL
jgi:hypothetical protein